MSAYAAKILKIKLENSLFICNAEIMFVGKYYKYSSKFIETVGQRNIYFKNGQLALRS